MASENYSTNKLCSACLTEYPLTADYFYTSVKDHEKFRNTCKWCWTRKRPSLLNEERKLWKREDVFFTSQGMRRCTFCEDVKPLNYNNFYYRNKRNKSFRPWCKECHNIKYAPSSEKMKFNYAKHRDKILKEKELYRIKNRTNLRVYSRQYTKEHPEKTRAANSRRRARERGLPCMWTPENEKFARQYFHFSCAICGTSDGLWHIIAMDHWIPISNSESPGTVPHNMVPLCNIISGAPEGTPYCNNKKSSKLPEAWLVSLLGKRKAMKKIREIALFFQEACAYAQRLNVVIFPC